MFKWIKERAAYFYQHNFVRDIAILQVGNIAGNFGQAIIGILLARILQPELFGIYALVFSLAGLLSVFLGLSGQDAVTTILSGAYVKQDKAVVTESLAFLVKMVFITGCIAILGALTAPWIAQRFYHNSMIGVYAGVIILASVISTSFYSFTTMILQIVGKIKTMTALGLADQITRSGLALLAVVFGFKVVGIVIAHFIGASIIFVISVYLWEKVKQEHPIFPSVKELIKHAWHAQIGKYFSFSFWIAVDRNIANLYNILPVLIAGMFVATAQLAYFKIAFAYINLALAFLSPVSTLLNVEFPKMHVADFKKLANNFARVSFYSLGLTFIIGLGAIIAAPIAFKVVYGTKFLPAIPYVRGLFFYGAFLGIGVGLGPMMRALNRVKVSILINVITLAIGIPMAIILIKHWSLWGMVFAVSFWYLFSHYISFFYLYWYLRKGPQAETSS